MHNMVLPHSEDMSQTSTETNLLTNDAQSAVYSALLMFIKASIKQFIIMFVFYIKK